MTVESLLFLSVLYLSDPLGSLLWMDELDFCSDGGLLLRWLQCLLTAHWPTVVPHLGSSQPVFHLCVCVCVIEPRLSPCQTPVQCNWILPCFTESSKAWHWKQGKYTQHRETAQDSKTNRVWSLSSKNFELRKDASLGNRASRLP